MRITIITCILFLSCSYLKSNGLQHDSGTGSLPCGSLPESWPPVSGLPVIRQLPDPLVMFDGTPVTSVGDWKEKRRPELISLFKHYMYGYSPAPPENFSYTIDYTDNTKFDGKATLKLVTLRFGPPGTPEVSMMIVIPNDREGPVPVFFGLNFPGNHTTADFPEIPLTGAWVNNSWTGATDNRAHDDQRGIREWRWPYEMVIDRGYAVATIYAGEISPDYDGGFTEGVHRGYFTEQQERPGPHEWGVVSAWAWGIKRGVDYIVEDPDLDNDGIIVIGHSRLGKAAMVAGAFDERIDIIIPSQAGSGGTSPNRFNVGESVERINTVFPHWFNDAFKEFNNHVERLPFDQHSLIALAAPRPLLLTNATDDEWADPGGQFNMLVAATPVYELLGVEGIETNLMPPQNQLVSSRLGFFIRPGRHDMTAIEWEAWMDFCDRHLGRQ
ncbi:MAG: acetylxylan esterase [Marinilabiliales bacterium]|nr:MAG: acetylxylan esterase [Marinilabiliales bacterium]